MTDVIEKVMYACGCCKELYEKKEDAENCCFLEMQRIQGKVCGMCLKEIYPSVMSTVTIIIERGSAFSMGLHSNFHVDCFVNCVGSKNFDTIRGKLLSWNKVKKIKEGLNKNKNPPKNA